MFIGTDLSVDGQNRPHSVRSSGIGRVHRASGVPPTAAISLHRRELAFGAKRGRHADAPRDTWNAMKKIEVKQNTFYMIAFFLALMFWAPLVFCNDSSFLLMFFPAYIISHILIKLCIRYLVEI